MATTLSKRAEADMDNLAESLRAKAQTLIDRLDSEPALGKKLLGKLTGKRSIPLGRTHRIIYEITGADVRVLTIPMRRDAYR